MIDNLQMSGLDYSLAPIALREQLSFTKTRVEKLNTQLTQIDGVEGCVLLSTCNRTELYLSLNGTATATPGELLCRVAGVDYRPLAHAFVQRSGEEAAEHLMEVASGLKSQILGEDQILSQVKTAVALARGVDTTDGLLETLFRTAVSAGKAVKHRVRLTRMPTSAAHQGVRALAETCGGLEGKRAMVIGNGEMGRLAAQLLRDGGCQVTVTLRTYRHGETVVPAGCDVAPYEERYTAMEGMDILVSATTSPHYTVGVAEYSEVKQPPQYLADLAIPRDIAPQIGELSGVTLFNVDNMDGNLGERADPKALEEAKEVRALHMDRLRRWCGYRESIPAIEEAKEAIFHRVWNSSARGDKLDDEELVEFAVNRTVELLAGGLKEGLSAQALADCAQKIRDQAPTGRRTLFKEDDHG